MDAISLVANLIAVASAAASVYEKLRKLANSRHVPQQIFLLANEVADFRCVLVSAEETIHPLNEGPAVNANPDLTLVIRRLIGRAHTNLDEVNEILDSGLIRNLDAAKPERAKISWGKWLRKHGNLQRLSATLREIRRDLSEALTVLTASESPSVRAHLESITFMTDETKKAASKAAESIDMQLESVTQQVASIQPSLEEMAVTLQQLQVAQQPPKLVFNTATQIPHKTTDGGSTFRVRTALQKSCNSSCRCRCHERTSLSSPQWMKDIVGLMFIDYSGKPILGKQTCNEKLCHQQESGLLKITYFFPVWLLQRMIVFRNYSKSLLAGESMISIRTPRIIDPMGDPVSVALRGNIQAMQLLFSQRLASPFDTTPIGESLLHLAASEGKSDMCKLLLLESADPSQRSIREGSPIDIVWDNYLQNPNTQSNQELKAVFEPFLDADTDLHPKRFSILHQCVLGLNRMNLEEYLQITTAEIESTCSIGRTPLFWAASSGNLHATTTLLKFGASTNHADPKGQNVLHRAVMGSDIEVLKTILRVACMRDHQPCNHSPPKVSSTTKAEDFHPCSECPPSDSVRKLLHQEDSYGWAPLAFAAMKKDPEKTKVLLDFGATVKNTHDGLAPALLVAVQVDSVHVAKLLLENGAKTNVKDSYFKDTVLHLSATFGGRDMFELLGDANNSCLCTLDETSTGLTPLQVFDTERPKFLDEDEKDFLENRAAFLRLLEKVEEWNLDHGESKDTGGSETFELELNKDPETISADSDDEDFFDTISTFDGSLEIPQKEM